MGRGVGLGWVELGWSGGGALWNTCPILGLSAKDAPLHKKALASNLLPKQVQKQNGAYNKSYYFFFLLNWSTGLIQASHFSMGAAFQPLN